jgi:serine/threonine-protein kinase
VDRQTFLGYLRASGLVAEADLQGVLKQMPEVTRGRLIARALVERGLLTRFQAERLLVGRTSGFHLGQYRILDQLGRGGMGRVFKAEHRTMGRTVALKVLSASLVDADRAEDLFLREVRAAAQLAHPNIVTAYDANQVDGRFYLVMEFVDGPNLDQLVRKQGPLGVGLACDYIRQVAAGLQCAHLLGMVHRDIKPANILVQRKGLSEEQPGLVKISDFGLARLHSPTAPSPVPAAHMGTILAKDNTVMGTPDYLSPEQSRNLHKVDIRSDLYSLGCTFYFLLTGQVPFPGGNALDKLIRHTTDQPLPVSSFRKDVPQPVVEILDRMLAKHPDDRFQTPAELVAALEPYSVSGQIPWAPSPTATLMADGPDTPVSGVLPGSDPEMEAASDELAALANTLGNDAQPTPLSGASPSGAITPLPETIELPRPGHGLWKTLLLAMCLGGMLVVAGLTVKHLLGK